MFVAWQSYLLVVLIYLFLFHCKLRLARCNLHAVILAGQWSRYSLYPPALRVLLFNVRECDVLYSMKQDYNRACDPWIICVEQLRADDVTYRFSSGFQQRARSHRVVPIIEIREFLPVFATSQPQTPATPGMVFLVNFLNTQRLKLKNSSLIFLCVIFERNWQKWLKFSHFFIF